MKKILFFAIYLFTNGIIAQEFGNAVLFNSQEVKGKHETILIENIKKGFKNQLLKHTEFYIWDGNSTSAPQPFAQLNDPDTNPRPITRAVYIKTNFKVNEQIKHSYDVDSTGKVIRMYLDYGIQAAPKSKLIDLVTSEVLESKNWNTKDWGLTQKLKIDHKKYFGNVDPKILSRKNRRDFNEKMKLIRKDQKERITKFYTTKTNLIASNLSRIASTIKALDDKRLWKAHQVDMSAKGKLGEFYIDASADEKIVKGEYIGVYQKSTFGKFRHYDRVASVFVKAVAADQTKVKPVAFSKKKIKAALESGDEIVFARSQQLINQENKVEKTIKRVQIKNQCFTCSSYLEKLLLSIPTIKLIERNFEGPIKYFTDQYTDEKFIDFNMADIQFKQEGIDYLFENTSAGFKATEIESGRIASVNQDKGRGLMKLMSLPGPQIINLCMDIMGKNLEILEILKEKKGKTQRILVYNPFGFDNISTFRMAILHEEKVGGRTIIREEEIGKAYVGKRITNTICELKINKGEKNLYTALQAGEKVNFIVKL